MRIILIVSDTFRYDHLGVNGNDWIRTPELDEFGRDAVVFDNYYVSSFPTIPNRCDMATGRYGFPFHGWQPLLAEEVPLAERLSAAGMHTQLICDCPHLLGRGANFWRGFEAYLWNRGQENDVYFLRLNDPPESSMPRPKTRWADGSRYDVGIADLHRWTNQEWQWEGDTFPATTSRLACKWVEKNYRCEDLFLWVDFFDVHEPWDPPLHFTELYDPGFDCARVIHPNYGYASAFTPAELRNMRANYAGEVTLVSKWIGMLLRKLADCGIYDDSFIIFATDHGMYLGEHDRTGKTNLHEDDDRGVWPLYEEITHIPLMIKPPHCEGGVRRDEVVQPPDICATVLEAARVEVPGDMAGRPLQSLLGGDDVDWPRECAVSAAGSGAGLQSSSPLTVTDGEWSLHLGCDRAPELYRVSADPAQQHESAEANPAEVRKLHAALMGLLAQVSAPEGSVEAARGMLRQWSSDYPPRKHR